MDEAGAIKRQLIEAYLVLHHFRNVESRDQMAFHHALINLHFCMNSEGRRYDLAVQRQWMDLKSNKTISQRLDTLQVVPFLLENKAAWVGVTTTGQEVITHIEPDAKT